ncbi:Hypothetical protein MVR_LOCUS264 [uncultured virus]|nr:Hypothetical protein MVR_LOCUS264 [uncultured virus]
MPKYILINPCLFGNIQLVTIAINQNEAIKEIYRQISAVFLNASKLRIITIMNDDTKRLHHFRVDEIINYTDNVYEPQVNYSIYAVKNVLNRSLEAKMLQLYQQALREYETERTNQYYNDILANLVNTYDLDDKYRDIQKIVYFTLPQYSREVYLPSFQNYMLANFEINNGLILQ